MLVFFLCFRLLSSSPVLVLSNRKDYRDSTIVITYMKSKGIPRENWKHYQDWIEGDFCNEEGGEKKPFTRVYLWEDSWQWIGTLKKLKGYGFANKLFDKLEACNDIIEINIDGGPYLYPRIAEDEVRMRNYAEKLVKKLKETKKTTLKITWYDNAVFGMNWSLGPHKDKKKFTWTKKADNYDQQVETVKQETYTNFYKEMTSKVCYQNGECFGILAAYSYVTVKCQDIIDNDKELLDKCNDKYSEYTRGLGNHRKVSSVKPLVEYLETLKIKREDKKVEL